MDSIFQHTDGSGDALRITNHFTGIRLWFETEDGECGDVVVPRGAALSLVQALSEWAYPVHTPEAPNRSLIEQMIDRAVKDQVAAVLPLHLSPVATCRVGACDAARHLSDRPQRWPDPEPTHLSPATLPYGGECPGCTPMGCTDPSHAGPADPEPLLFRCRRCGASPNGAHENCAGDERACVYIRPGDAGYDLLSDPEPHDVGHPTYEDARPLVRVGPSHCGECTHSMKDHIALGGCWGSNGTCECGLLPKDPVPVVESDKVWGDAGQPPVACTCNPTAFHPHDTNGCMHPSCTCKWVRG